MRRGTRCCVPAEDTLTDLENSWLGRMASRHLNFFRLHLLYFLILCTTFAITVWGIEQSNPKNELSFIDALFTAFSSSKLAVHSRFRFDAMTCDHSPTS